MELLKKLETWNKDKTQKRLKSILIGYLMLMVIFLAVSWSVTLEWLKLTMGVFIILIGALSLSMHAKFIRYQTRYWSEDELNKLNKYIEELKK